MRLQPTMFQTCFLALLVFLVSAFPEVLQAEERNRPNVVLIMTDNHGAWTLGCYGNPDIRTPNIDGLAEEGLLFRRAFSSNAVCSPTRATYLTGLLPSQHGVHCFLRRNRAQMGPDAYCTIEEFQTLPKVLSKAGYVCGLSGKWHLGNNLHPQEGFTDWITMPHGGTRTFYDAEVIEDGNVRKEPKYLTDLWTEHGVEFIEKNKDKPFFLFLSYNGPYGLGGSLLKPARNRHADYYADEPLLSFPRERMHPWLFNNKEYLNNPQAMRRFAAELSGVDDGVGRILETLKENELNEETLVVFTADQGWAGGQEGLWGMGDHTRPLHAFDTTMHVPLIYRHPGKIPSGEKTDIMVNNYDFLPTLLSYLGMDEVQLADPPSPGRDYADVLRGKSVSWENVVYYDFENTRAVRTADWKYVHRYPDGPHELYDLQNDPGEQFNLYGQPQQKEIQKDLRRQLFAFFKKYAHPKYDLWNGGGTKPRLLTQEKFPHLEGR